MHHPDAHQVIHTGGAPWPAWRRAARAAKRWGSRRAAFTLTELVVSVGILGLMMAMVGTVFKLTIDSTGEATSLTEITQSLRLLEETLRKDLAQIPQNPGETMSGAMMVIQANAINAYWRAEYAELDVEDDDPFTGYPHDPDPEREITTPDAPGRPTTDSAGRPVPALPRADVLMFFTSAEGKKSFRSCPYPEIEAKMAQVVYGHAELGELDSTGAWPPAGPPNDFAMHPQIAVLGTVFPDAAQTWHLARRTVLVVDQSEADLDPHVPDGTPGKKIPGMLDDTFDDDGDRSYSSEPLQDGVIDLVDNAFVYKDEVSARKDLASPFSPIWFARSRLDPTPPALQAQRLGAHLLPRCASFKVEWALDLRDFVDFTGAGTNPPRELVWFDPARMNALGAPDPLGELDALAARYTALGATAVADKLNNDASGSPPDLKRQLLTNRFSHATYGINGQTPVWFGNDDMNYQGSEDEPDRFFPKALRITVDVYDDSGRFQRPIRQVMVLPVGGG